MTGDLEHWAELSNRVTNGDRSAESQLARLFLPRIYAMILQRTRDRDLAEDLRQEAALRALCSLREGKVREAHNLPGFVFGIVRNLLSDTYREREREKLVELPLELNQEGAGNRARVELGCQVQDAIARLGDLDQRILRMTVLEGKKPAEIARELNISGTAIRQRKHRAIKKVTRMFKRRRHAPAA